MKIDRTIQREILEFLADAHPDTPIDMSEYLRDKYKEKELIANCAYLHGHGLIKSGYRQSNNRGMIWRAEFPFEITSTGLDFLMDDGGLGAILGVVTVKLDASSIKALVLNRINQTEDITHEERSRLETLVRTAGDQSLRKLVDSSIEKGLQAIPNTPQLIGMLQGLFA